MALSLTVFWDVMALSVITYCPLRYNDRVSSLTVPWDTMALSLAVPWDTVALSVIT